MAGLETGYLGLKLASPVIVAASPLTQNVVSLKKCEEAGAGAVVLKSVFEEQIMEEVNAEVKNNDSYLNFSQARSEFERMTTDFHFARYERLLTAAKKELRIPVIASICCKSLENWALYARRFESCGADAVELNYYPVTSDSRVEGKDVDRDFETFVRYARQHISLPLSIKMGSRYSGLANKIKFMDKCGIDGAVLFNRTFRPDIDLDEMKIIGGTPTTQPSDYTNTLRWTALMAAEVKMDICSNTGIHNGETAVKMLLAGAKAVEVASAPILNGFGAITEINNGIRRFMENKGYGSISDFCGLLTQENSSEGWMWERTQFLKIISRS